MHNILSGGSNMSNERIRELSKQAGQGDMFSVPPKFIDLFAKLIVAECVAVCQDVDGEDNIDARSGRQDCAVEIKEHFGVENKENA
jgi:hypothetical protein